MKNLKKFIDINGKHNHEQVIFNSIYVKSNINK